MPADKSQTAITLKPGPRFVVSRNYRVRIAYFDVDNTLVNNESMDLPSKRFVRAALSAEGSLLVALATARPLPQVSHILTAIKSQGLSIISNGAQIYDCPAGRIVAEWVVGNETSGWLLDRLEHSPYDFWVNDDGLDDYAARSSDGSVAYWRPVDPANRHSQRRLAPGYKPLKPFVFNLHDIRQEQLPDIERLVGECGDPEIVSYIAHQTKQADGSVRYDVFITHRQANKRHALEVATKMAGVPMDQVMFVGDGPNDAGLVGAAGVGVAMGNSVKETLDAATHIAPNQWDDGAAIALEQFTKKGV